MNTENMIHEDALPESQFEIQVGGNQQPMRLDVYLNQQVKFLSRNQIQLMVKSGLILADGEKVKPGFKIKPGSVLSLELPPFEKMELEAEPIPLNIIYEDSHIAVIDKPVNMPVHPGAGHYSGTLANALLYYFNQLSDENGELRPGIVHRLDMDTSGVIVTAKNNQAHRNLSLQFSSRTVEKRYSAICWGCPDPVAGTISNFLNRSKSHRTLFAVSSEGKLAVTRYETVEYFTNFSLLDVGLETGRTHQIRVHLAYLGHSIVGDPDYGSDETRKKQVRIDKDVANQVVAYCRRQMLHARVLKLNHPVSGKRMTFESVLPADFRMIIDLLRKTRIPTE